MRDATGADRRKRGRPATTGKSQLVGVRLPPDDVSLLDTWIAANDPEIGRPEAIRRILRILAMPGVPK